MYFRSFLLYLINLKAGRFQHLANYVEEVDARLNYIIIEDEIIFIDKLEEMEIFQDFELAYPLLIEFKK